MTAAHSLTLEAPSPGYTSCIAQRLAPALRAGDVILLDGPVGAGKTHFARSLIASLLPAPEDIPSPTFTLVQTYAGEDAEIWHADLYRLSDPAEIEELGLSQAFDEAICLVEWPDRLGEAAPTEALRLTLVPGDDPLQRRLSFGWQDARWDAPLEGLHHV